MNLITAQAMALKTGRSDRYFTRLAASGDIDWAYQPKGANTNWLFDEDGYTAWVIKGAKKPCRKTSTKNQGGTTRAKPSRASSTAGPSKQSLKERLRSAQQHGSKS